jgi:hypothetical protein
MEKRAEQVHELAGFLRDNVWDEIDLYERLDKIFEDWLGAYLETYEDLWFDKPIIAEEAEYDELPRLEMHSDGFLEWN